MAEQNLEQRIIDLEVKVSFMEALVETLNSVVKAQADKLDKLQSTLEQVKDQVGSGVADPTHVNPPHY